MKKKKKEIIDCGLIRIVDGRTIDARKNDCLGSSCKKCGWNKGRVKNV